MATQYVAVTLYVAHYGIDVAKAQEVLRAQRRTPVPLADPDIAGLVNLLGEVIMTVDFRARLGLPPLPQGPPDTLVGTTRELIVGADKLEHGLPLALDVDRATA